MSKEAPKFERPIPEVVAKLGDVRKLFLKRGFKDPEIQRASQAIWGICSFFYPEERFGSTDLPSVPSRRLVELGLVSDETGKRIVHRATNQSSQDANTVRIERLKTDQGEEYKITEGYTTREGRYHVIDAGRDGKISEASLDSTVNEVTTLKRGQDGRITAEIKGLEQSSHLHFLDNRWVLSASGETSQPIQKQQPLEITPRRYNTTLALLVESLAPGHIK